jgi:membrane fusion protein (multidrug efflux system)
MSKAQTRVLIGFIIVFFLFAGIKGCQIYRAIQAGAYTPPPEAVTTAVATEATWQGAFQTIGSVAPISGALLSAQQSGTVTKVNFESGSNVQAGAVLVELDSTVESAQLKGAIAYEARMKKSFERAASLRQKNAISIDEYDNTSALYQQATSAAEALRAVITRKQIVAPFSGKAGIRLVNVGDYVREGQAIVPLHNLSTVLINFSVPQEKLAQVHVGNAIALSLDNNEATRFEGTVTAVNPNVNESTRSVSVQATVHNSSDERLRPGMFTNVSLTLNEATSGLIIPVTSINYAPYGDSVFIAQKGDGDIRDIRQQFVKVGTKRGDQVQIISGITAGDEVVTSGLFKLYPGAKILINNSLKPGETINPQPKDT